MPTINNWKISDSTFPFFAHSPNTQSTHKLLCALFYTHLPREWWKKFMRNFPPLFQEKNRTWATLLMYYSHLKRYIECVWRQRKCNFEWINFQIHFHVHLSFATWRIENRAEEKANKFKFIYSKVFSWPPASNIKFVEEKFHRINLMEMCVHDVIHKNIYMLASLPRTARYY